MENILIFMLVGFIAQMIDGALGMAYGVSSTTFLLSLGVPTKIASASVHVSEMFTTLASGISHLKFGNVDKALFKKLVIPGVIGGVLGAYVLSSIPGDKIKPFVSCYLLLMGLRILVKAVRRAKETQIERYNGRVVPLGLIGGFFDAIGGGGWGPIVTTTLVARGNCPRLSIGSVNAAEFLVTIAESATFIITIPNLITQQWRIILGLLVGGVIAAPVAAYSVKKLPTRALMVMVGLLIIGLSLRTILKAWVF